MELETIAQVHQTRLAMEARRSTMAQPLVPPTRLAVAVSRLDTMTRLAVAVSRLETMTRLAVAGSRLETMARLAHIERMARPKRAWCIQINFGEFAHWGCLDQWLHERPCASEGQCACTPDTRWL